MDEGLPVTSSHPPPTELTAVARWLEQWRKQQRIPGLAFVVTDSDRTLTVITSGIADAVTQRPVTDELRWQIGSISKAFTAIALLQLERTGHLTLADPVVRHLPFARHLRSDVTLHHLLTHTAGLPGGSEWCPDSLAETALLGSLGNPQPPGSAYHYSNCGYEAAGDVVEAVTGRPLEHHLEQAVLGPLGMTRARGAIRSADRPHEVLGHRPPDVDRPWHRDVDQIPDLWFPSCTADGAVTATPEDLAVYARFLLHGNGEVLHPLDHERLGQPYVQAPGEGHYGYGLRITTEESGRSIGHSGGMVGSYADVRVDPELGLGCALFINGLGDASETNRYLLERLRAATRGQSMPPAPAVPDAIEQPDEALSAAELAPYVGLYRAHNPWQPVIRVIRRDGRLATVEPTTGQLDALLPRLEGGFHPGAATSPELVTFDLMVDGRYLVLDASGCRYYRARRDLA